MFDISAIIAGSGGVDGVPVLGCKCNTCKSTDQHDERMRTSIFLQFDYKPKSREKNSKDNFYLIFDCGNDFREQCLNHSIWNLSALFLTDGQPSHVFGLDDIRTYTFDLDIPIYVTEDAIDGIKSKFSYVFNVFQVGGGLPKFSLHPAKHNEHIIFPGEKYTSFFKDCEFEGFIKPNGEKTMDIDILPFHCYNKRRNSIGYRIGNFAYIPDTKIVPDESIELIKGVSILIISCTGIKPRNNRMNIDDAIELILKVQSKRNYFVHITHNNTHKEIEDYIQKIKSEREELKDIEIYPTFDGMKIEGLSVY